MTASVGWRLPTKIEGFDVKHEYSLESVHVDMSSDMLVLIGANNAGKTNLMRALNEFSTPPGRGSGNVTPETFFEGNVEKPIEVLVTYNKLSDEDRRSLSKYVLEDRVIVRMSLKYDKDDEKFIREYHGATGRTTDGTLEFSDTAFEGFRGTRHPGIPKTVWIPAIRDPSLDTQKSPEMLGEILQGIFQRLSEDALRPVHELVTRLTKMLNRPEEGTDERLAEIVSLEDELSSKLGDMMSGASVNLNFDPPTFETFGKPRVRINDGIVTDYARKGQGMKSALIFTIFRYYAEHVVRKSPDGTPLVFLMEEPELYLHPHLQRTLLRVLQTISLTDQVVLSTHSPYFIDMENYQTLGLVRKKGLATSIIQTKTGLFSVSDKRELKLAVEFNPERNELFFGAKVILVEGPGDKYAVLTAAKVLGEDLDSKGISVIECGSRDNIAFFVRIVGTFHIPFSVMYDADPTSDNSAQIVGRIHQESEQAGNCICEVVLDPKLEGVLGSRKDHLSPIEVRSLLETFSADRVPTPIKGILFNTVGATDH